MLKVFALVCNGVYSLVTHGLSEYTCNIESFGIGFY